MTTFREKESMHMNSLKIETIDMLLETIESTAAPFTLYRIDIVAW